MNRQEIIDTIPESERSSEAGHFQSFLESVDILQKQLNVSLTANQILSSWKRWVYERHLLFHTKIL